MWIDKINNTQFARQKNGRDCGVFTSIAGLAILARYKPPHSLDGTAWRRALRVRLSECSGVDKDETRLQYLVEREFTANDPQDALHTGNDECRDDVIEEGRIVVGRRQEHVESGKIMDALPQLHQYAWSILWRGPRHIESRRRPSGRS